MRKIEMLIPINPTAQRRARATSRGRFATVYKDAKQRENEGDLISLLTDYIPETPFEGPLKVSINCFMKIPKSTSKKKLKMMEEIDFYHIKKPDVDNLVKQALDCLSKTNFWFDDTQVCILDSVKIYSKNPRWEISIEETELNYL